MAEYHHEYTPYHYAFNNPLLYIDPLGMDTVNVNSDQPVKQDDVVVMEDGSTVISSVDEIVVTPGENPDNETAETNTGELPEVEIAEEGGGNPAGDILKAGMATALVLAVDPVPGDEVAAAVATLVTAGVAWVGYEIYQFAKSKPGKAGEVSGSEHTTGARKSTQAKHQQGQTRKQQVNRDKKRQKSNWKPRK